MIRESIPDRHREPEAFAKWVAARLAGPEDLFEIESADMLDAMLSTEIAAILAETDGIPEPADE